MGIPYSHISPEEGEKNIALNHVRELHKKQWDGDEDIPYKESIYKLIDEVVEYQLEHISDSELEDFYRVQMEKHYEDIRNTTELANEYMKILEAFG